jgi:hypothetical protein
VLDLKVEIASLAREMSTGIQQYQVVGTGSPQSSRRLEAISRIDFDAATSQDPGANVASVLVGIDEEDFLVIENRAATKWWWLVHTAPPKPEHVCGKLGRILLPGGGEVNNRIMKKPRWPVGAFISSELFVGAWAAVNPAVASIELKLAQG